MGEKLRQLSRGVHHKLPWERSKKTLSVPLKRVVRKEFVKHFLVSHQKVASTQTLGSAFLDRIRKTQNFELIDCFIDDNGSVISEHVNFFNNV